MNLFKYTFFLITSTLIIGCATSKSTEQQKTPDVVVVNKTDNDNETVHQLGLTKNQLKSWQHLDLATDSVPGMSVDKAHKFLQGKQGTEVIVAVIDTGIDFNHEDLKEIAWTNTDEIAGNGIDDDKNGYVDDIHGWNFIGKMEKAFFEGNRILANPSIADAKTVAELQKEYELELKSAKEQAITLQEDKVYAEKSLRAFTNADEAFTKHFGKKDYTKKEILAIKNADEKLSNHIAFVKQMFEYGSNSMKDIKSDITTTINDLTKEYSKNQELIAGTYLKNNYRKVLGDNPNDITNTNYGDGNTQPMKASEMHGSHVAGIIAAKRNNNKGINGVANNVKIMALRAIPGDGDEHDKDVALAIRYAVDNGAKVINGSFGKSYSPYKKWVYDAIKYAAEKDVLIVNASGNTGDNIDNVKTYPNDTPSDFKEIADNFLVVGASGPKYDASIVAHFSNYGKQNVDVFAPGIEIYSAAPNNNYESAGGTSMAAPGAAGVAALVRSHYPELTASQVKHILMNSGTKINFKVNKPSSMSLWGLDDIGTENKQAQGLIPFSDLSVSGSIVNAYNALKMADEITNKKK